MNSGSGMNSCAGRSGSSRISRPTWPAATSRSASTVGLSLAHSSVGSAPFAWHDVVIARIGGNVTWTVDGLLIATIPVADDTVLTGDNIFFGHSDTNGTSSTDPNDVNLLFTLIDNVSVVPEPTTLSLVGLAGLAALRRRRA